MACLRVIQLPAARTPLRHPLRHPREGRLCRAMHTQAQRRDLDCMDYKEVPRVQDYHRLVRRLQMRVIQLENELRSTELVYKETLDMLALWQSEPLPQKHDLDLPTMNEL